MGNGWVMVSPQQFFFDVLSSHAHCSSMSPLHRLKSFMPCSITGCCPEFRTALSLQQGSSTGFRGTSAPAPTAPPSLTVVFTGAFLSVFFLSRCSHVLSPLLNTLRQSRPQGGCGAWPSPVGCHWSCLETAVSGTAQPWPLLTQRPCRPLPPPGPLSLVQLGTF